jgi:hypothetical protein
MCYYQYELGNAWCHLLFTEHIISADRKQSHVISKRLH